MPGLTLCLAAEQLNLESKFHGAQSLMLHASDYQATVDAFAPGLIVGHVGYPQYPVRTFQANGCLIAIEGRVYERRKNVELESSLRCLADTIWTNGEETHRSIRSWILGWEGEYLVVIADPRKKRLVIFNDPLGRLPFVYFVDAKQFVAAREDKFVARFAKTGLDRLGAAETLWTGYALGARTLFEGVVRLPAGSLLLAEARDSQISTQLTSLMEFDFDDKDYSRRIETNASDLEDLILSAAASRGCDSPAQLNVISLSGGQDSRAAAIAMKKVGAACVSTTFISSSGYGRKDARLAKQISEKLSIPWYLIQVPDGGNFEAHRLVTMTDGHNLITMSFILSFMDAIIARWGRSATYVTGDGGDKLFPNILPRRLVSNVDALVREISEDHAIVPAPIVEKIFHLPAGTLEAELRALLLSYPEQNLAQKSVHYTIFERGHNWLFEGEDRARFFLWQSTPFYSFPIFQYAMRVPDSFKLHNRLYRMLQMRLDPEVAAIPDATYGVGSDSWLFAWKMRLLACALKVPRGLRRKIKAGVEPYRRAQFEEWWSSSTDVKSLMDRDVIHESLSSAELRSIRCCQTLYLLEALWTKPSPDQVKDETYCAA